MNSQQDSGNLARGDEESCLFRYHAYRSSSPEEELGHRQLKKAIPIWLMVGTSTCEKTSTSRAKGGYGRGDKRGRASGYSQGNRDVGGRKDELRRDLLRPTRSRVGFEGNGVRGALVECMRGCPNISDPPRLKKAKEGRDDRLIEDR